MLSFLAGSKIDAVKESNSLWNQLSLRMESEAVKQPALLTGGTLHEHQMKVCLSCLQSWDCEVKI